MDRLNEQTEKPNVLLICVDQWGGELMRPAGHPVVMTPTLSQLARSGVNETPAAWKTDTSASPRIAGLRMERDLHVEQIERRTRRMYDEGLLDEVRLLLDTGFDDFPTASHAIGYAEAAGHVRGNFTLEQAVETTVTRTRKLAKRQMTWFRNQADVEWVDVTPGMKAGTVAETTALYGLAGTLEGNQQVTEMVFGLFDYLYSV